MSAGWKFEAISETLKEGDNMLNARMLCEIAGVSRSGYCRWVKAAPAREERERRDREDFELILKAYRERGYDKGARGVYMRMLHWDEPVVMNLKKIRRLMDKYGLVRPIRKANPEDGEGDENERRRGKRPEPGIHGTRGQESFAYGHYVYTL